jgi:hypothetical protein
VEHRERSATFTFDGVFGPDSTQEEVYASLAAPLLLVRLPSPLATCTPPTTDMGWQDVLEGFEAAILAYGQSGSGKTHSLLSEGGSSEGDAGLFPRLAADLFTAIESDYRSFYAVEGAPQQSVREPV